MKQTYPLGMSCVAEMERTAIVGKVRKDNSQIDKPCKNTGADTTNRSR